MPAKRKLSQREEKPIPVRPEKPYEKPETLIEWEGPVRVFNARDLSWFAGLFLLALILVVGLAFLKQFTLMLVVIAFTFVFYSLNRVEPRKIHYQIRTTGIKIGTREYSYDHLKWFWGQREGDEVILRVSTYLNLPHLLLLVVPREKYPEVERTLLRYLPYHEERARDYLQWLEGLVEVFSSFVPSSLLRRVRRFGG